MARAKMTGLGRGLESLFGEVEIMPSVKENSEEKGIDKGSKEGKKNKSENSVEYIDINKITPNKDQPRKSFSEEKIEELANSIKEHGIIQPLVVRKIDKGYEIVAGERRYRAARRADLKTVPCLIRELTDEQNMLLAIIENVQREDLNPIEEAESLEKLITAYGLTQEQVSKSVGKSRPYITNSLRLLKLPEEIRNMVIAGDISHGHARALINVEDKSKQLVLAKRAKDEGLSVRIIEQLAGTLTTTKKKPVKKVKEKNPNISKIEEDLRRTLGTRVNIIQAGKKGKVEIECFSLDELERIIDLLKSIGS